MGIVLHPPRPLAMNPLIVSIAIVLVAAWVLLPRPKWLLLILLCVSGVLIGFERAEVATPPKLIRDGSHVIRVDRKQDLASHARTELTRLMQRVIPAREAGLYAGILYGDPNFSKLDRAMYRDAGLMHLVAVSGSNVGMVLEAIVFAAVFLRWRRGATWYACLIGMAAFSLFTGLSSSVARACWLAFFSLLARRIGRLPHSAHLLLVVAAGMALMDPWIVRYDAGYALSFCAGWGMVIWAPMLIASIPTRYPGWLREAIGATVAATGTTTTYLLYAFQQCSPYSLLANVLAAPLVPLTMLFSAMSVVFGIARISSSAISTVLSLPAIWIEWIAAWVSAFPYAHVMADGWWWEITAFVWMLVEWLRWKNRKRAIVDNAFMFDETFGSTNTNELTIRET